MKHPKKPNPAITTTERVILRVIQCNSVNTLEAQKAEAILILANGKRVCVTANAIGVSEKTVYQWRQDFKERRLTSIREDLILVSDTPNAALSGSTVGSTTPNGSADSATPDNAVGSATPNNADGSATPNNAADSATPDSADGSTTPDSADSSATPNSTANSTTPSNAVDFATPRYVG